MSLANSAQATQIGYLRGVRELILESNKLPEEHSVQQLKRFLVQLRDTKNLASSTVNIRVCGLKYYFRQVVKRSGIKKKVTSHTLRHSYAVHFLNNGGHLPQLKTLLGHKHISTTLHYLKYAHIPLKQIVTPLDHLMIPQDENKI